ncbi:uncharacterized protein LOC141588663 [Silene latifolia]|uniref:uncharacterized protein LOC141588663 n=1 Tax=Silene latifolia TaxID=37657 RepID=UPI003D770950
MWLLKGVATFSKASGLCLNKDKSAAYFNGVHNTIVNEIIQVSGFQKGTMPFRYLGVLIPAKRISKNEGQQIIDRIVKRIRSWEARHLSYAGKLALIKSILITLHSYRASIFLIPSGIMNKIQSLCRNYPWKGNDAYSKVIPKVKWDTLVKKGYRNDEWLGNEKGYTVRGGYQWLS